MPARLSISSIARLRALGERGVAGGERLVDHEDRRIGGQGDRELQACRHPRGVGAHGQIDRFARALTAPRPPRTRNRPAPGSSPIARAPRRTFCAPVRSGMKRGPDSEQHWPDDVRTVPELGASRPARVRSSVDFPEPLRPMTPMNSPDRATKETPRRAATLTTCLRGHRPEQALTRLAIRALHFVPHAHVVRHDGQRGLVQGPVQGLSSIASSISDYFRIIAVHRHSFASPRQKNRNPKSRSPARPAAQDHPGLRRRQGAVHQHGAVHLQHLEDRDWPRSRHVATGCGEHLVDREDHSGAVHEQAARRRTSAATVSGKSETDAGQDERDAHVQHPLQREDGDDQQPSSRRLLVRRDDGDHHEHRTYSPHHLQAVTEHR